MVKVTGERTTARASLRNRGVEVIVRHCVFCSCLVARGAALSIEKFSLDAIVAELDVESPTMMYYTLAVDWHSIVRPLTR